MTRQEVARFTYLRKKAPDLTTEEKKQLHSLELKIELARAQAPGLSLNEFLKRGAV